MKKKLLFIMFLCVATKVNFASANDLVTEIECRMNVKSTAGIYYREDISQDRFVIDDKSKSLYIYANGTRIPIVGNFIAFNENEIIVNGINLDKNENIDININRRNGSIFMNRVKTNIWVGDTITRYHGDCAKLNNKKAF